MSKERIAILMGGVSSEHEVSLRSGAKVVENLSENNYESLPITIAKTGDWHFPDGSAAPFPEGFARLAALEPACVFLALHGPFGEDGRIQGLLDLAGIPYTGSGCMASALAMDKVRSKAVVAQHGIRTAGQIVPTRWEWQRDPAAVLNAVEAGVGFPCVAKSPCQGSSLGMSIPKDAAEFSDAMSALLKLDSSVLAEQYIRGREVTCAVLDVVAGERPRALPVTEIKPVTSAFFDYHAKYTPGACLEITPADLSRQVAARVQNIAVRVHEAIGCRGLSRSDMILDGDDPVWIEVNTIPGMTETSLFPQAAAAVGITFAELLDLLIREACAR